MFPWDLYDLWDLCVPCAGATRQNLQLRRRKVPSLARALAVTLRLVRVYLAHLFQQVPRVGPRDIRRARTVAVPRLRPPGQGWFLHAFRHAKKVRDKSLKGKRSTRRGLASMAPKCQSASPCIARP